jgi:hypothetical protein
MSRPREVDANYLLNRMMYDKFVDKGTDALEETHSQTERRRGCTITPSANIPKDGTITLQEWRKQNMSDTPNPFENVPGERFSSGVVIPKVLTLDDSPGGGRRIVIDGVPFPYGTQGRIRITLTDGGPYMNPELVKMRVVYIPVLVEEVQILTPEESQYRTMIQNVSSDALPMAPPKDEHAEHLAKPVAPTDFKPGSVNAT